MTKLKNKSEAVTLFLDKLNHPLRHPIEQLRIIILNAHKDLEENIKWNAPNYSLQNNDRITMRIQPSNQLQLIFHRGAKVLEQLKEKLIQENTGLLTWKENDRAIATFKNMAEVEKNAPILNKIVNDWLKASI